MFQNVPHFAGDPILSLVDEFKRDPRPEKVNLSIGIYLNERGEIPTLSSVVSAEAQMPLRSTISPAYLPMGGMESLQAGVHTLLFGSDSAIVDERRIATIQTLGGSGALKVGADFLRRYLPASQVWVSNVTWDNHVGIFEGAGFTVNRYAYYSATTRAVDMTGLKADLSKLPKDSVVVFHPCCHNPTGADLTREQWDELVPVIQAREIVPFLDMAYLGFGQSVEDDAYAVRAFANAGLTFFVSNSFSKTFSLYNERIGSLSVVCNDADVAARVSGQLHSTVRTNYSSPPATGVRIVTTVLGSEPLRQLWIRDVSQMRERILGMRAQLRSALEARRPADDFSHITAQRGMFSFTGLSPARVQHMKEQWGVYLVGNGRLCVAGLTPNNVDYVADAYASSLQR